MKVRYLDLGVSEKTLRKELLNRVEHVLTHGQIIDGPEQDEFEQRVAEAVGVRYAVGVSSGSSALYLALKVVGVGVGDEVITSPFSWIITANAIVATGAKPVFVDVSNDFNLDPNLIKSAISPKTRAIVPVHVAGHMCDMVEIGRISKEADIKIVEDAAQAFCGSLNGRRAGAFSSAAGFSMNPMKVLHAYGEAGVVTTNNKRYYQKLKQLRHAGTRRDLTGKKINICQFISLNHKIDTIQAALLLTSLDRIDYVKHQRDKIAEYYDFHLENVMDVQKTRVGEIHGRYIYLAACRNRDELRKFLTCCNIETKIFYSPLVCDAKVYRTGKRQALPTARRLEKRSISLPLHEKMSMKQAAYVINSIKKFYKNY